jgi:hypothetical protein
VKKWQEEGMTFLRTPTKITGGITEQEKDALRKHADLWIARAMRTEPIDPSKIIPAIEGLYVAAKLPRPRVVIVPSPLVMAFAYGAAAAIWDQRTARADAASDAATYAATYAATRDATEAATYAATDDATYAATYAATHAATVAATRDATVAATRAATYAATYAVTRDATYAATEAATEAATHAATDVATRDATLAATEAATHAATYAATRDATSAATRAATAEAVSGAARARAELSGLFGLQCASRWSAVYQGGNMWGAYDSYLTAMRDVLGLKLPAHKAYAYWEQAAIEGGFRVMHPEFCLVSDFPEVLRVDEQNRPHCADGPSHRWRDGWSLFYWHGVAVPAAWIIRKDILTAQIALSQENLELRRAACEILGWETILTQLKGRTIDRDADPQLGELVEVNLPGTERGKIRARYLRVRCGTGRKFAVCVPPEINTVLDAQAWMQGLNRSDFAIPEIRT